MINLVISGGQTGADIGGLIAAKKAGVKTSGWMPKGWKTLDGPRPAYANTFGVKEHSSSSYNERTWDNVLWADGTLRIAGNFNSAGEKCTLNAIKNYDKPYYDIDISLWSKLSVLDKEQLYEAIEKWINKYEIRVLNVAGNSEQTWPGIEKIAVEIIRNIL